MFGHRHYVPILKWKAGEQRALRDCSEETKNGMTPLIEVPPVPWDFDNDCPSKTVDEHIVKVPEKILQSWGTERPFFLDTYLIRSEVCEDGGAPITKIADSCRDLALRMIPVVRIRTSDSELSVIRSIVERDARGVCLRVTEDDLEDESVFRIMVRDVLRTLNVEYDNADLILDLGYHPEPVRLPYARALISTVLSVSTRWRTFTLACTSIPQNMTQIRRDTIDPLVRIEWALWERLLTFHSAGHIQRMPSFGDYCIANPELTEMDPKAMNLSGHIRYTTDEEFLIVKGGAVRDVKRNGEVVAEGRGYEQMVDLCRVLINLPEYSGADFSWGDRYIWDCANGTASHGNPTTWRQFATNHHLTFVVHQLANHPALAAGL